MTYGENMNNLTEICSRVWATSDINTKRILLKEAVANFKYKHKNQEILERIEVAKSDDLDRFAANLILNKTDKVVGLLPR